MTQNLAFKCSAAFFLEEGRFRRDWTRYHSIKEKPNSSYAQINTQDGMSVCPLRWMGATDSCLKHVLLFQYLFHPMEIKHIFIIIACWICDYSFSSFSSSPKKNRSLTILQNHIYIVRQFKNHHHCPAFSRLLHQDHNYALIVHEKYSRDAKRQAFWPSNA